jgi:hypothetical protein
MDKNMRKLMALKFINRPFFEMEQRELNGFLIEVMFNAEQIKKGKEPAFPYNEVSNPLDLANCMIADLQREISLRN